MNDNRPRQGDGHAREALGDMARDVMDHLAVIARDRAQLARLTLRHRMDHLRDDVAPKALWGTAALLCAALAGISGLLALFLAIAWALGSVAWTFLIFAALFTAGTIVAAGFVKRPPRLRTAEDIERTYPAVRAHEHVTPEHALARQQTPEAHRMIVEEARREHAREAAQNGAEHR